MLISRRKNQKIDENQKIKGFVGKKSNYWKRDHMTEIELFIYYLDKAKNQIKTETSALFRALISAAGNSKLTIVFFS